MTMKKLYILFLFLHTQIYISFNSYFEVKINCKSLSGGCKYTTRFNVKGQFSNLGINYTNLLYIKFIRHIKLSFQSFHITKLLTTMTRICWESSNNIIVSF